MCSFETYHNEVNKFRQAVRDGYILFVDDCKELIDMLGRAAKAFGYESKGVGTISEAISIIEKEQKSIRSVVIDLHLKGVDIVDGEGLIRYVEEKTNIPYVVYTADPDAGAFIKRNNRRATVILKGGDIRNLFDALSIGGNFGKAI